MDKVESLINEISGYLKVFDDNDQYERIRKICTELRHNEDSSYINRDKVPKGPNILLAIELPLFKDHISFLCLESDFKDSYYIGLWKNGNNPDSPMRRINFWDINKNSAEAILSSFTDKLKTILDEFLNIKNV